jgi:predicted  nucleic acid-binding Zn-ribbon protein
MDEKLKANLKLLAQLQFTDTEREAIEKKLAGVEESIAALGAQLAAFEQQVAQEREQLDSVKKHYRASESEVQSIENSIGKSDDKLGAVKTNKEYQSMLKGIDDLKVKKGLIEDSMIEMLDQIADADRQAAILKADLVDMRREIENKQADIRKGAEEQRLELEDLNEERDAIWARLDTKLQKMYARAKHQGRGIAVAAVENAICLVCRVNIPPQAYIELLRINSLSMCPSCQRIMYPKAIMEEDI